MQDTYLQDEIQLTVTLSNCLDELEKECWLMVKMFS